MSFVKIRVRGIYEFIQPEYFNENKDKKLKTTNEAEEMYDI